MGKIGYLARVIRGVRFKKINQMLTITKERCGHSKIRTFFDMAWCAVRYGAGYYDYVMFGFYDMTGKQRNTYLTRVRNKTVMQTMNDYTYADEFDDKLRFNQRFAEFLHRKTLNGETATEEEMAAFLEGQSHIFAKPNHGSCGSGVTKLAVADFASPKVLLNYIREKKLVILEHVLPQHETFAKLHPDSVNTMRICTDLVDGQVHIAYVVIKIGTGGKCCDNSGQGGVICRVDEKKQCICSVATDDYFQIFDTHPTTGIKFEGYQLPMVDKAIALAKRAALVVPQIRHIGWDVAMTPDGPAIIEGNEYPGTDLCQLAPHYPEKTGLWPYYKNLLKL